MTIGYNGYKTDRHLQQTQKKPHHNKIKYTYTENKKMFAVHWVTQEQCLQAFCTTAEGVNRGQAKPQRKQSCSLISTNDRFNEHRHSIDIFF